MSRPSILPIREVSESLSGASESATVTMDKTATAEDRYAASTYWSKAYHARKVILPRTQPVWKDELEAIATQFVDAKARYNALSPIYSLPNELLACVFEILARTNGYRNKRCMWEWGWICITHVSKHFRSVAIEHASLWATLTLDMHIPCDIFFSRSRQCLLDIDSDYLTESGFTIDEIVSCQASAVKENVTRLRILDIRRRNMSSSEAHAWTQVLEVATPELRALTLDFSLLSPSEPPVHQSPMPVNICASFLNANAPKLRNLKLRGLQMPWNFTSTLLLQSLCLYCAHRSDGDRRMYVGLSQFTFPEVLQCLQRLPALEYLTLWRSLPESEDELPSTPVVFQHLKSVSVTDGDIRCLFLWGVLDVPPTCTIRVELQDDLDDDTTACLLVCLEHHFARSACPTYQRLLVAGDSDDGWSDELIHLAFYTTPEEVYNVCRYGRSRSPAGSGTPLLQLTIPAIYETELVCSLFSLVPHEHIETLALSDVLPRTLDLEKITRKALYHFKEIKLLSISGVMNDYNNRRLGQLIDGFSSCLFRQCVRQCAGRTTADAFLPKLDTLLVEEVNFGCSSDRSVGAPRLANTLAKFLELRASAKIPVRTLQFLDCDIGNGRTHTWSGWVEELIDDCCCGYTSDGGDEDWGRELSDTDEEYSMAEAPIGSQ